MTTYTERLMKIGLAVAEIFGRICWFLLSRPKRCSCYRHNLWSYWTECHQNCTQVQKFILFNDMKSELRYCNPFWNGSATNEIVPRKTPIFRLYWSPCQHPLSDRKRGPYRSYLNKHLSFGAKITKIGPVILRKFVSIKKCKQNI